MTYDSADRLMSVADSRSGVPSAGFMYQRDGENQVISTTPSGINQGPEADTYTQLNQLATAGSARYGYDAADNITQLASGATASYDAANELLSAGSTSFGYGARGDRLSMTPSLGSGDPTTYSYDQSEQLTSAQPSLWPAAAAGHFHSLALRSDGTVWSWGSNAQGQLGDGTTTNRPQRVLVSGLSGVTAIAAGGYHSLALRSDGTVWAWGQ